MTVILQTIFWNLVVVFLYENRISIQISIKFVPNGPINYGPVFVHIMDKPLSERIMVYFTGTYMCHSVLMSYNIFENLVVRRATDH